MSRSLIFNYPEPCPNLRYASTGQVLQEVFNPLTVYIAGKGVANAESMMEAIKTAVWLSQGKGLTGKGVGR